MSMVKSGFFLVAVHGGAGYHTDDSEPEVKRAMRLACKKSLGSLQIGAEALDAVESAITVLEDDPCLNAGCGSNLTLDGTVECDASLMDGHTADFGGVGAVSGVKNPISAARSVLNYARLPDPLGRIPPTLLVSSGALNFVQQKGVPCVDADSLVCPRALAEWKMWKERLVSSSSQVEPEAYASTDGKELHSIQDTVGAVAWDSEGNVAAGVSSGGLLLKLPGRVGEAAIWGAGCWAQQPKHIIDKSRGNSVACSVSGSGEYIVREMLAKSICEAIVYSPEVDMHGVLFDKLLRFQKNARTRGEVEPIVGVLLLVGEDDEEGEVHPRLWCAFTTQSMAIAYASSLDPKPKATILRKLKPSKGDIASQIYITALSLTR